MATSYDCVVVGAGIEGSATAYWLAKNGKQRTLLLEKFPLPHTRGSSHGASRIARIVYAENTDYIPVMHECYELWNQLEQEVGYKLMRNTGRLHMGRRSEEVINTNIKAMQRFNLPYQLLSSEQISEKFPELQFDKDWEGIYDPSSAVLYANKCLNAFQTKYVENGGVIRDSEPVISITPGNHIKVQTSRNVYTCDSIVICVGPWARTFCKQLGLDLPIQPECLINCYWKVQKEGAYSAAGGFPILNITDKEYGHFYGTPEDEYPGMFKLCSAQGVTFASAEERDCIPAEERQNKELLPAKHISRYMRNLSKTPCIVEHCIHTLSTDESAIIGPHPDYKNIIIGAGFTGHGFKLAPYAGKVMAALAMGQNPSYPESFKISRFKNNCRFMNRL